MSQDHLVILKSTESKHVRRTRKNKKKVQRKLEVKKYDPIVRKRVTYKEAKK